MKYRINRLLIVFSLFLIVFRTAIYLKCVPNPRRRGVAYQGKHFFTNTTPLKNHAPFIIEAYQIWLDRYYFDLTIEYIGIHRSAEEILWRFDNEDARIGSHHELALVA